MSEGRRGAAGGGTLLALAVSATIAAAPTGAATYKVVECVPEYGGIGAPDAQGFANGMGPTLADTCTPAGSFNGLTANGQDAGDHFLNARNGWQFFAPQDTQFTNAVMLARGASQAGVFPEILSLGAGGGAFQWANTGAAMPGSNAWLGWNGEGGPANAIELRVRCATAQCGDSGGAYITASHFGFTLSETSAPKIDGVGGPLVETGPHRSLRGTVGVGVGATDAGSGLYAAYVEKGGQLLAGAGFDCAVTGDGAGRRLVPCPRQGGRLLAVDTANPVFYTGLNHGVRVCVVDFAGQASCQDGPDMRIDNACPDAGAAVASLADVGFKGGGSNRGDTPITRFGRKVKLRGQALDGAGTPVGGATICLGHHIAGDAYGGEEVNWTKTGRSGRFRFKLQRGPSQDFRIAAWRGGSALEQYRTLLVKAKPKLKIKGKARPGKRIRLRVALNPPAIAGKAVRIEAKSNAGWVGVPRCNGQTDSEGRFGCRARIPEGTAGAKLQYRAVVPRESDYPYLRGHSRVKSKRVRG